MAKPWIGVDLDGTLATYEDGQTDIGDPIYPMLTMIKDWMRNGQEVRIFTARAGTASEIPKIENWLKDNSIGGLKVTNIKDKYMVAHYDDKAIRVQFNSGTLCPGCNHAQFQHTSHQQSRNYGLLPVYHERHGFGSQTIETDC